jgi:hypothetical protein
MGDPAGPAAGLQELRENSVGFDRPPGNAACISVRHRKLYWIPLQRPSRIGRQVRLKELIEIVDVISLYPSPHFRKRGCWSSRTCCGGPSQGWFS